MSRNTTLQPVANCQCGRWKSPTAATCWFCYAAKVRTENNSRYTACPTCGKTKTRIAKSCIKCAHERLRSHRGWDVEDLVEMRLEGKTLAEIAAAANLTSARVQSLLLRFEGYDKRPLNKVLGVVIGKQK